ARHGLVEGDRAAVVGAAAGGDRAERAPAGRVRQADDVLAAELGERRGRAAEQPGQPGPEAGGLYRDRGGRGPGAVRGPGQPLGDLLGPGDAGRVDRAAVRAVRRVYEPADGQHW